MCVYSQQNCVKIIFLPYFSLTHAPVPSLPHLQLWKQVTKAFLVRGISREETVPVVLKHSLANSAHHKNVWVSTSKAKGVSWLISDLEAVILGRNGFVTDYCWHVKGWHDKHLDLRAESLSYAVIITCDR